MPQPHRLSGSFFEDGPLTLYCIWQRDDDRTNVLPGDVTSYDLSIYDLKGTDPDTAIWQLLAASPTGVFVSLQPGVGASPAGYTFKKQIGVGDLDSTSRAWGPTTGGRKYQAVAVANSPLKDVNKSKVIWDLDCKEP